MHGLFPASESPIDYLTGKGDLGAELAWLSVAMSAITAVSFLVMCLILRRVFCRCQLQKELIGIFAVCGAACHGCYVLSVWLPDLAHTLRLLFLGILLVCSLLFLRHSRGVHVTVHRQIVDLEEDLVGAAQDGHVDIQALLQKLRQEIRLTRDLVDGSKK